MIFCVAIATRVSPSYVSMAVQRFYPCMERNVSTMIVIRTLGILRRKQNHDC